VGGGGLLGGIDDDQLVQYLATGDERFTLLHDGAQEFLHLCGKLVKTGHVTFYHFTINQQVAAENAHQLPRDMTTASDNIYSTLGTGKVQLRE